MFSSALSASNCLKCWVRHSLFAQGGRQRLATCNRLVFQQQMCFQLLAAACILGVAMHMRHHCQFRFDFTAVIASSCADMFLSIAEDQNSGL